MPIKWPPKFHINLGVPELPPPPPPPPLQYLKIFLKNTIFLVLPSAVKSYGSLKPTIKTNDIRVPFSQWTAETTLIGTSITFTLSVGNQVSKVVALHTQTVTRGVRTTQRTDTCWRHRSFDIYEKYCLVMFLLEEQVNRKQHTCVPINQKWHGTQ